MVKLEAGEDPYIQYWNALTLQAEAKKEEANQSFEKGLLSANEPLKKRITYAS